MIQYMTKFVWTHNNLTHICFFLVTVATKLEAHNCISGLNNYRSEWLLSSPLSDLSDEIFLRLFNFQHLCHFCWGLLLLFVRTVSSRESPGRSMLVLFYNDGDYVLLETSKAYKKGVYPHLNLYLNTIDSLGLLRVP